MEIVLKCTYPQQISGHITLLIIPIPRPPPLPLSIIALPQDHQVVVDEERQFVVVLCLVGEHRVHLARIHDSQFFLDV